MLFPNGGIGAPMGGGVHRFGPPQRGRAAHPLLRLHPTLMHLLRQGGIVKLILVLLVIVFLVVCSDGGSRNFLSGWWIRTSNKVSELWRSRFSEPKDRVSALIAAIEDVDFDVFQRLVHTIPSSAKYSGTYPIGLEEVPLHFGGKRTIFYKENQMMKGKDENVAEIYYDHSVAYYLSRMREDHSFAAKHLLEHIKNRSFFGQVNEHIRPRYHPLTCAYRQQRYNVAETLLHDSFSPSEPFIASLPYSNVVSKTIPEVYASYLDCSDILRLNPNVTLVTFMGERRQCVLEYPRTARFGASKLFQYLESRGQRPDPFESVPSRLPLVGQTPRQIVREPLPNGISESPFHKPPVGVLPGFHQTIMNPACFEDFVSAVSFYFMGTLKDFFWGRFFLQSLLWVTFFGLLLIIVLTIINGFISPLARTLQHRVCYFFHLRRQSNAQRSESG